MQPSIENIPLKRKPRAVSSFLKKTYDLLSESENFCCIHWSPNGIGFIVTSEQLFSRTVLPKYFKHNNYSSFVRQLNMYNFHKIRQTNSQSYFHHQSFDRDNKNLLCDIKRKPQRKKRKNQEDQDHQDGDSIVMDQQNKIHTNHLAHRYINSQANKYINTQNNRYINSQANKCINQQAFIYIQRQANRCMKSQVNKSMNSQAHRRMNQQAIRYNNSQAHVSIKLIQQNDQQIKSQKNTANYVNSQTYHNQSIKMQSSSQVQSKVSIKQQKSIINYYDDDKLSINQQIDRIPRFNTKELFFPSTNNLYPFFGHFQSNTFGFFY